jgi:hypothetical protein
MRSENEDYVTLKWGTVKSYNIVTDEVWDLMKKYLEMGTSMSAMAQRDTPDQKQLLCDIITLIGKPVYLEWDGKYVSVEKAKEYIMNYDND